MNYLHLTQFFIPIRFLFRRKEVFDPLLLRFPYLIRYEITHKWPLPHVTYFVFTRSKVGSSVFSVIKEDKEVHRSPVTTSSTVTCEKCNRPLTNLVSKTVKKFVSYFFLLCFPCFLTVCWVNLESSGVNSWVSRDRRGVDQLIFPPYLLSHKSILYVVVPWIGTTSLTYTLMRHYI